MNVNISSNNINDFTSITYKNEQNIDAKNTKIDEDSSKSKAQKSYEELTPSEKQVVSELQARDTEVKAHEAAHQAAGAGLAGGASFSYEKGPDGKMYAIGGEVPISFKEGKNPKETIANARQVKAAALAPANPSPQDYAVANTATMMELKAQQQLQKELQTQKEGLKIYTNNSIN